MPLCGTAPGFLRRLDSGGERRSLDDRKAVLMAGEFAPLRTALEFHRYYHTERTDVTPGRPETPAHKSTLDPARVP
jgi:hypothetical protein